MDGRRLPPGGAHQLAEPASRPGQMRSGCCAGGLRRARWSAGRVVVDGWCCTDAPALDELLCGEAGHADLRCNVLDQVRRGRSAARGDSPFGLPECTFSIGTAVGHDARIAGVQTSADHLWITLCSPSSVRRHASLAGQAPVRRDQDRRDGTKAARARFRSQPRARCGRRHGYRGPLPVNLLNAGRAETDPQRPGPGRTVSGYVPYLPPRLIKLLTCTADQPITYSR